MNPIIAYELHYISFSELEALLWDFGPNKIFEVGEKCYVFYLNKSNCLHEYDYYIKKYGSDLYAKSEWLCI